MITGNKGEWSELYVFLKLLGDGGVHAADANLNKIGSLYYPLLEILRKENNLTKHYINSDNNIKIVNNSGNVILKLPVEEFKKKAAYLLQIIKTSEATFSVPEIEKFMDVINCTKIKADSTDKSDITVVIHDCMTGRNDTFGFSIKSCLGCSSTLLNAGTSTNFIYEIYGNLSNEEIEQINTINTKSKIKDRLNMIMQHKCRLNFCKLENEIFESNLQMIDSQFPLIISEFLLLYFCGNGSAFSVLTPMVKQSNPCKFNTNNSKNTYEYKVKNFLTDISLGMTPATEWSGKYQATGGYLIVREDGEVLCYHIYNHNEFQEYIFKNTRLDTPSSSRYHFGKIYTENGKNYIKLNLQIRFA